MLLKFRLIRIVRAQWGVGTKGSLGTPIENSDWQKKARQILISSITNLYGLANKGSSTDLSERRIIFSRFREGPNPPT